MCITFWVFRDTEWGKKSLTSIWHWVYGSVIFWGPFPTSKDQISILCLFSSSLEIWNFPVGKASHVPCPPPSGAQSVPNPQLPIPGSSMPFARALLLSQKEVVSMVFEPYFWFFISFSAIGSSAFVAYWLFDFYSFDGFLLVGRRSNWSKQFLVESIKCLPVRGIALLWIEYFY